MQLYITRDKDNALVMSNRKLNKQREKWDLPRSKKYQYIDIPDSWYRSVKWSDEQPTPVCLHTGRK